MRFPALGRSSLGWLISDSLIFCILETLALKSMHSVLALFLSQFVLVLLAPRAQLLKYVVV